MPPKILDFNALAPLVRERHGAGQRVALVHSTSDSLDNLDRDMLRSIRASADVVVATVAHSGPTTVAASEQLVRRAERIAGIDEVDFVAVVPWSSAARAIMALEPEIYAFASVGTHAGTPTAEELDALAAMGTELFTLTRRGDTVVEWRQRAEPGSRDRQRFAQWLRDRVTMADVTAGLQAMSKLKVAVVGETIIDEYAYCDAIGKSGKEPVIVNRFLGCDAQAGGVLAVANHLADFCGHVEVVSALGEVDSREDFVRSSLRPEIKPSFVTKSGAPTIVKRRYVDAYSRAKMMGVYHMDLAPLKGDDEQRFVEALRASLARCDVVVVADYGHGLITPAGVSTLAAYAGFLAVNTQINAANTGYHVLSKYPRADYGCLHEGELRLDARDTETELPKLLETTADRLGARALMATQGRKGTVLFTRGSGLVRCPALASVVVERIGAGDAVLAISAVATAANLPPELVSVMANLAGAQMVAVMGNSASIRRARLLEGLRHLLTPTLDNSGSLGREIHVVQG